MAHITRVKLSDGFAVKLYMVSLEGDTKNRNYDPTGKTVTATAYKPDGSTKSYVPTISASDDTSKSAYMAEVSFPGSDIDQLGIWKVLLTVTEDELTFGPYEFKVVDRLHPID